MIIRMRLIESIIFSRAEIFSLQYYIGVLTFSNDGVLELKGSHKNKDEANHIIIEKGIYIC